MVVMASLRPDSTEPVHAEAWNRPHVFRWDGLLSRPTDIAIVGTVDAVRTGAVMARWFSLTETSELLVGCSEPEVAVAVRPEHRGAGFAGLLIEHLKGEASLRGHGLSLTVSVRNPIAERIYVRHGFRVIVEDEQRKAMVWTNRTARPVSVF
jgi:GNAT superfamily N-acetyltransferase